MAVMQDFKQSISLTGVAFNLTFRFNARMNAWILDVADGKQVTLIRGIPIVEGFPILAKFMGRIPGLPVGFLFCLDVTRAHREPGADLLGTDCLMLYGGG